MALHGNLAVHIGDDLIAERRGREGKKRGGGCGGWAAEEEGISGEEQQLGVSKSKFDDKRKSDGLT